VTFTGVFARWIYIGPNQLSAALKVNVFPLLAQRIHNDIITIPYIGGTAAAAPPPSGLATLPSVGAVL